MTTTARETVTLAGGTVVSLPALRVLWDLEARGFDIRLGDDGGLLVGPNRLLNDADRAGIRQHKAELVTLIRYVEALS